MKKIRRMLVLFRKRISTISFYFALKRHMTILAEKNISFYKCKCQISGRQNSITCKENSELSKTSLTVVGNGNVIEINNNTKLIECNILVRGDNNHIVIGRDINMKQMRLFMHDSNNTFKLGNRTTCSGLTEIYIKEGTSVTIGEDCLLSRDIIIRTSDGHSILDMNTCRINPSESVNIANNNWICQRVMIMKGVCTGEHTIIGAGTVLTKTDKAVNAIIAGNPGRVIKKGIKWSRELQAKAKMQGKE